MYTSFVIPVMNEEENIQPLHSGIVQVGKKLHHSFEVIFVDDGSTDQTLSNIRTLHPVKIVVMRKNFGQTAALDAGIKQALGKYIVTLDGDLQNDPEDVVRMLSYLKKHDLDVVCGWRKRRHDTALKVFISQGARFFRSFLVRDGIHDSGCTLRIYKRECFTDIQLRGEMHRFIPSILKWHGFRIGEVEVHHRARTSGHSKYGFQRMIKGFLDMLSLWFFQKYSSRPLHFLGTIGMFLFSLGVCSGIGLFVGRLFFHYSLSNRITPLIAVFSTLFGFQMFVSGLIMESIVGMRERKYYDVKEIASQ